MEYAVILFNSNNNVLWTAQILKEQHIKYKLIPVPRDLSHDCGYCIRIAKKDSQNAEEVLLKKSVDYKAITDLLE